MALNVLRDIKQIYAGLNTEEIRAAAWRDANVGLQASTEEEYVRMEAFLAPPGIDPNVRQAALRATHRIGATPIDSPAKYDFVLCGQGIPLPRNGFLFDPTDYNAMAKLIVAENDGKELSLARTFPMLRKPVCDRLINKVSRENALFSLVTALPNVIPSIIELPWTLGEFATDTAFLTMNQIRLALTIAAAHGRPVGYMEQKAEMAAIAAGAFGWRAIARELVGKIPLGGGLIPKAAVAFAGTYVVGLGLEKVNRTGTGLSRQEKQDAYADAFEKGKEAVRELAPQVVPGS